MFGDSGTNKRNDVLVSSDRQSWKLSIGISSMYHHRLSLFDGLTLAHGPVSLLCPCATLSTDSTT